MRGGKREGAGRPKGVALPPVADKTYAAEVLKALDAGGAGPKAGDTPIIARFRELAFAQDMRISLDTLKYLLDKRDGKAVQPLSHDGNLEHTFIWDIPAPERERKK